MGVPGTDLTGWRWLRGRADRREFWLWVVVLWAWTAVLSFAPGNPVHLVAGLALTLQVIRRLHDLGLSGGWVVGFIAGQLLAGGVASAAGAPDRLAWTIAGWAAFIALLALGLCPGQRGVNRFGPPRRGRDLPDASASA